MYDIYSSPSPPRQCLGHSGVRKPYDHLAFLKCNLPKTQKAPEYNIMHRWRWCVLKKRSKLNYSAPSLPVAFFVRFLLSLRSFASLRFPRSLRFASLSLFASLRFPLLRFFSFLHPIVEFPSLSFRFSLLRYLLLLFAAFLSFFSFPRCTIIEFAELKAPPPPLHCVIP